MIAQHFTTFWAKLQIFELHSVNDVTVLIPSFEFCLEYLSSYFQSLKILSRRKSIGLSDQPCHWTKIEASELWNHILNALKLYLQENLPKVMAYSHSNVHFIHFHFECKISSLCHNLVSFSLLFFSTRQPHDKLGHWSSKLSGLNRSPVLGHHSSFRHWTQWKLGRYSVHRSPSSLSKVKKLRSFLSFFCVGVFAHWLHYIRTVHSGESSFLGKEPISCCWGQWPSWIVLGIANSSSNSELAFSQPDPIEQEPDWYLPICLLSSNQSECLPRTHRDGFWSFCLHRLWPPATNLTYTQYSQRETSLSQTGLVLALQRFPSLPSQLVCQPWSLVFYSILTTPWVLLIQSGQSKICDRSSFRPLCPNKSRKMPFWWVEISYFRLKWPPRFMVELVFKLKTPPRRVEVQDSVTKTLSGFKAGFIETEVG